ncbi:MAG TPA: sugar phosphate isomerase/epimerase [Candidatus Didemnitutus sp.]|nr:sugar phosphate isomerase/epimerase [Candidatus Didemnitutus sp.]
MQRSQLAAQLFTVRDFCGTAADLTATARKLRAIGYEAVQHTWSCPVPPAEVARIMQGEGLKICASHDSSANVLQAPQRVVENLQQLGCTLTAYPYPHGIDFTDPAVVRGFVRNLDASGAVLRAAGLTLGYHNHGLEFLPFEGGTVLDYIYAQTNPSHLVGEIDTYWIHFGGGDCVEWCRKLAGRLPFIHLKDYRMTPEHKPTWAEIGRGTLPFARIIAEAERAGCQWFIVEQDTCEGDPFESLRQSFDYLMRNIVASPGA